MPRLISICLIAMLLAGCRGDKQSGQGEPGKSGNEPGGPTANAARVLVRERHSGVVAADGLLFLVSYSLVMAKDENRQGTVLTTAAGRVVESESRTEFKSPVDKKPISTPADWKKEPRNFDFLLDWNIDWTEHRKASMEQGLVFTVKETWKLEKVSDPRTAKSWSITYDLRGPDVFIGTPEQDEKAVTEQVKTVIRPLREPVLKEVQSFIEGNR